MRKEIDNTISSPAPFLSTSGYKGKPNKEEKREKKFARISVDDKSSKSQNKKSSKKRNRGKSEKSADRTERKRPAEDIQSKAPKKLRT